MELTPSSMLGRDNMAQNLWRGIDGWLRAPYGEGAIGRLGSAQPKGNPSSDEGAYDDRLETGNLFTLQPGSKRFRPCQVESANRDGVTLFCGETIHEDEVFADVSCRAAFVFHFGCRSGFGLATIAVNLRPSSSSGKDRSSPCESRTAPRRPSRCRGSATKIGSMSSS